MSPDQPSSPKSAQPPEDTSSFPAGAYTTGTIFPLRSEPAPIRPPTTDPDGSGPDYSLRCRTVMVTNIPRNIREPKMLRWYFGRYLPEPPKQGDSGAEEDQLNSWQKIIPSREIPPIQVLKSHNGKLHKVNPAVSKGKPLDPETHVEAAIREFEMTFEDVPRVNSRGMELIEHVVLAPKLSGLADLIQKREEEMERLEEAHIVLAEAVMAGVAKEMGRRAREENRKIREGGLRRRKWIRDELRQGGGQGASRSEENGGGWLGGFRDRLERVWWVVERLVWGEPDRSPETDELLRKIGPFVELAQARDAEYGIGSWARGVSAWIKLKLEEKRKDSKKASEGGVTEQGSPVDEGEKTRRTMDENNEPTDFDSKAADSLASPTSPTFKPPTPPVPPINGYVSSPEHKPSSQPRDSNPPDDTVWTALHSLPPGTLQRFHPYTRQRSVVLYPLELVGLLSPKLLPTIDLAFLRVKSIQKLIEDYKARPLPDAKEKARRKDDIGKVTEMDKTFPGAGGESPMDQPSERKSNAIEPASSAFVTFRRWEDARRAARSLAHRPGKPLTCLVVMAPQTTDLDWERLAKGKFAAQFLRDWLVGAAVCNRLFQIFWIFPISFITGLVSIKSLETVFPPLVDFFKRNPHAQNLITGLIPTLLVAGLGILIPVILFAIGRKAQTEVTFSGLHDGPSTLAYHYLKCILIRYYKWLILNIVIFFCVGLTSFRTFLLAFRQKVPNPFEIVSEAFPAAAPFYASWYFIAVMTYEHSRPAFLKLGYVDLLFGFDALANLTSTPRKRKRGTQPRTIDYHYWTPNHLLAMHIVMIFAVLNPLVIPFALIYYSVANVVFRNQLLHVYARRFYEGNGKVITVRVLRYSMDGLALSHVVFLAFNLLNYNKARAGISGAMLGVTVISKMWATRAFKSRYERLEDAESARLCGHEEPFLAPGEHLSNEEAGPPTSAIPSNTPLPPDRLKTFQSPAAAMGPSTFSWNSPGFRNVGHKYDVRRVRGDPIRGKRKTNSPSLSRVPSRSGSRAEILRPDSPSASDETSVLVTSQTGTRLLPPQLGQVLELVQQVGQVSNNIRGYFTGKRSQSSMEEGVNYLGGTRPQELIVPQPLLKRWDDTPNGSASYECPYYLDEAPEAIWLPRDPSGPVDLDDTVFMFRLLLSVHRSGTSDGITAKESVDRQAKDDNGLKDRNGCPIARRPSMVTSDSERSGIAMPFTQSPAESPGESPHRTSPYSSHAARPNMLHVPTVSAERVTVGSSRGRRQSILETLEMANLEAPGRHHPATTLPLTSGETSAQSGARRPSLLSLFRPRRASGSGADAPRPVSMFSSSSATEGGGAKSDKRRGRLLPAEDVRKALDATVQAEEKRHQEQQAKNEQAEDREDERVENEETNGWNVLKRLVFKRNTE
ncbi:hypothetical protein FRC10_005712 [Ceratobasidium sp. 414]|nr:hypothetical protein FRC10_005712 [Ceratobasidium sp. 414]